MNRHKPKRAKNRGEPWKMTKWRPPWYKLSKQDDVILNLLFPKLCKFQNRSMLRNWCVPYWRCKFKSSQRSIEFRIPVSSERNISFHRNAQSPDSDKNISLKICWAMVNPVISEHQIVKDSKNNSLLPLFLPICLRYDYLWLAWLFFSSTESICRLLIVQIFKEKFPT